MIDHGAVLLACRSRLTSLSVCTTGAATLTATSTGYSRAAGSFLTDGFRPGMELVGTSFTEGANNAAKTITEVTATTVTAPGTVAEAAGTRTLAVVLPSSVSSENIDFEPSQNTPYFREEYLPGPMFQATVGMEGSLDAKPMYILKVHVPQKTGVKGAWGYVTAILDHFKPGTALSVSGHDLVQVRRDVAPFAGQLLMFEAFAVTTVTIPLWVRVANE